MTQEEKNKIAEECGLVVEHNGEEFYYTGTDAQWTIFDLQIN